MTRYILTGLLTMMTGNAMALINCHFELGPKKVEVLVIDTFIERMAFVDCQFRGGRSSVMEVPVKAFEKSRSVSFVNTKEDFYLSVDKQFYTRGMPQLHRAELFFGGIKTDMDCIVE